MTGHALPVVSCLNLLPHEEHAHTNEGPDGSYGPMHWCPGSSGFVIIAALPRCPECQQGKHPNCLGDAWDDVLDLPAPCGCYVEDPLIHLTAVTLIHHLLRRVELDEGTP